MWWRGARGGTGLQANGGCLCGKDAAKYGLWFQQVQQYMGEVMFHKILKLVY